MPLGAAAIVEGEASGPVLFCDTPLSFWGGVDPETGCVIDAYHPLHGRSLAGTVLVLPGTRGSSTGSGVALQLILNGKAPTAFVFGGAEEIVTLGVVVAREMFGISVPVLRLEGEGTREPAGWTTAQVARNRLVEYAASPAPDPSAVRASSREPAPGARPSGGLALSPADRAMLAGAQGPAARFGMRVITAMAAIYGASRLIDVSRVHIDGCIYTGPASLRFAQALRDMGARVCVPTTLNAISVDRARWRAQGVETGFGEAAEALADAYLAMGAEPTYTCAPYLLADAPVRGEQIAWAESNAVAFANSVLGARTMKYPDYLDLCMALTGRAPEAGVHRAEGRRASLVVPVPAPPDPDDSFWPLLGHCVGSLAGGRVPMVRGLEHLPVSRDDLKSFGAAFATTAGAPMFHIAGHTPEAMDVDDLPQAGDAREAPLTRAMLRETWRGFNGAAAEPLAIDLVSIGSPHASAAEIARIAHLVEGRRKHPDVRFAITCGRHVLAQAEAAGHRAALERFGAELIADTCWCMLGEPVVPPAARTILTNSGKYAHYGPGLTGRRVCLGNLGQCVEAACTGRFDPNAPAWLAAG